MERELMIANSVRSDSTTHHICLHTHTEQNTAEKIGTRHRGTRLVAYHNTTVFWRLCALFQIAIIKPARFGGELALARNAELFAVGFTAVCVLYKEERRRKV